MYSKCVSGHKEQCVYFLKIYTFWCPNFARGGGPKKTSDNVQSLKLFFIDGFPYLHLRSQECPPVSGRVPDKQKQADISELDKGINPSPFPNEIYIDWEVTLEPFGFAHLHLRSQEHPPLSGRVPDKQKQADILELDKGINPNPFPNER